MCKPEETADMVSYTGRKEMQDEPTLLKSNVGIERLLLHRRIS
jgi:hypothetical protein